MISGGVVLGVSICFVIIFILVLTCCLKNNNVDSNPNHHQQQNRRRKQKRPMKHEHSSHEITTISNAHRYDQPNDFHTQIYPSVHTGVTETTNYGYGKQVPQSPTKPSNWTMLNQSNSSNNSNNFRQNNYN
jgi:hypothetical protein